MILRHFLHHPVIDVLAEVDGIHIEIQIQNHVLLILKIVQSHIIIGKKPLHGGSRRIQALFQLAAADHVVPPQKGIGRIENVKRGIRVFLNHPFQKIHIPVDVGPVFLRCLFLRDFLGSAVVGEGVVSGKGVVLGPVVGSAFVIILQKGFRNHVRDILKDHILVQQIFHIRKRIAVVQIKRHGFIRKFRIRISGKGEQIQAVEYTVKRSFLCRHSHIIVQLSGHAGAFDRLDRLRAESLIKPAVIEIFRSGRTDEHAVIGKIPQSAGHLIFLFCKHRFQRAEGFMIMKKRVEHEHQPGRSKQQYGSRKKKASDKFLIHAFSFPILKVKINKGAHSGQGNDGPGEQKCQPECETEADLFSLDDLYRVFPGKHEETHRQEEHHGSDLSRSHQRRGDQG